MDPVTLALVVGLLVLNALFVAAEFGVVAAPRLAAEERAAAGSRWAARVARVAGSARDQDRYIATAQLGVTATSLGLGMVAEQRLASWLAEHVSQAGAPAWLASHAVAGVAAVVLLTYLHVVLGEMVPKALALANPLRAALLLAPVMRGLELVFYPIILSLTAVSTGMLRLFGLERGRSGDRGYSAEELEDMVRASEEQGLVGAESAQVLAELLDFSELTAREAMIPRVHIRGIEVGASQDDIAGALKVSPHTRYPVYAHDLDHIVGMVHIKDLVRRMSQGQTMGQSDVRPIPFVPGSATLDVVLDSLRRARVQLAVVMDEHGGTDGIISTEDLFEEVIGEIHDEVNAQPPELRAEPGGGLVVAGTVRLDEVGEELDVALEHEEVDTVSGLVLALLDRPPRVGDQVSYADLDFEVTLVEGHGVAECRVCRRPAEAAAPAGGDAGRDARD